MSRVEEIKARLEMAVPGPWKVSQDDPAQVATTDEEKIVWGPYPMYLARAETPMDRRARANICLIANAPQDLEYLLSELEQERATRLQLELKNERLKFLEGLTYAAALQAWSRNIELFFENRTLRNQEVQP